MTLPDSSVWRDLLAAVAREREACRVTPGLRERWSAVAYATLGLLFPHFAFARRGGAAEVRADAEALATALAEALAALPMLPDTADQLVASYLAELPATRAALLADARAHLEGDPAAGSLDEVILTYPGFRAIAHYRLARPLHVRRVPLAPRLLTELAHTATGIDIHPGAEIGAAFSIDHGTGVVIGETAVVGNRVKLYQGVTLGSVSVRKTLAGSKRHPTVDDDVVIYANATILGGDTVIGAGSVIGGNVWLTRSVPPGSIVTHDQMVARTRRPAEAESLLEFNI